MTLKELRLSKKLTQEQVANLLHVSRKTYIAYEQGKIDKDTPKYAYIYNTLDAYGKIDETHGILSILAIKEICADIMKDYSIEFCTLFGSYAKGKATEQSDVDLLVSMPTDGGEFFELSERLRENLHKKVDLVHKTQLKGNENLVLEILKDGVRIYG